MKQWDIVSYPYPSEAEAHPFVIISPNLVCADPRIQYVNALLCVTLRGAREAQGHEVLLNSADGLEWKTLLNCRMIYQLVKNRVLGAQYPRGIVSVARRRQIVRVLNHSLDFGKL